MAVALLLPLLVAAPAPLRAQAAHGSLAGHVTDPSGAALPGVEVAIRSLDRGGEDTATTDARGFFLRETLLPGRYQVTATRAGFRAAVVHDVRVGVDGRTTLDLRLEVGAVEESLTVRPEGGLLTRDRAEVATRLDAREVRELPNWDRNLTRVLLFTPGAELQQWQHAPSENPQASLQIMVNGQPFSGTGYLLDGVDNRENILGLIVINPTLESVAEVKVTSQNFEAEFGSALAGVVSVQTRSGTNTLHGSAFGNRESDRFQARNPFTEPPDVPLPEASRNLFGAALGGPLQRDHWFFFADYQGLRSTLGGSRLLTVPTARARQGDLSEYGVTVYDPAGGAPETRTPFPGAVIPADRLSPSALALLQQLPLPNRPGLTDNYLAQGSEQFDGDAGTLRLDGRLGRQTSVFARLSLADYDREGPASFGAAGGPEVVSLAGTARASNRSLALGLDRAFGSRSALEVRLGYYRYKVDVLQSDYGTAPAEAAGIPGLNLGADSSGLPALRVGGPYGFAFGSGSVGNCNCPLYEDESQRELAVSFSHLAGSHELKAGLDVKHAENLRVPSDVNRSGELSFSESGTRGPDGGGLGLATFLLGNVSSFGRFVSTTTDAHERQWRDAFYLQDRWRATSRLTLTAGLRLDDVHPQTVDAPGNGGWLDLATGEIRVAGVGGVGLDGDVGNNHYWAPRLGLAWTLDPRTVLRAAYGRSYDLGVDGSNFGESATQNLPVLLSQELNPANDYESVFPLDQGPPAAVFPTVPASGRFPLPDGAASRLLPASVRLPAVDAYMVGLQRQLGDATTAELAYVGNRSNRGYASADPTVNENQATLAGFPGLSTPERQPYYAGPVDGRGAAYGWTQEILYYCACARTRYDALQARLQRRFAAGYSLLASYTLQRVREDARDYFTVDRSLGWGRPDWDRTHSLVLTGIAELPVGRGRRYLSDASPWVDRLLGGWQVSTYAVVQSGMPFEVTYRDAGADRDTGPNRPDRVGDPQEGSGDGIDTPYFNVTPIGSPGSAFARPAAGTFGNLPRNALTGPGYWRVDASIFKRVRLGPRANLELRLDVINLFNHVNLDLPDAEVGVAGNPNPNAGLITNTAYSGTDPRRNLQFGARLEF